MSLTGYFNFLSITEEFFWQFPGILILKDVNSVYQATNQLTKKLLGFKSIENVVGILDYDICCDAVRFSDEARNLDKKILIEKEIKIFKYADGKVWTLLETRKLIVDTHNCPIGILCHAVPIENKNIVKIGMCLMKIQETARKLPSFQGGHFILGDEEYDNYHLTRQESICLFHILRGKTAKKIGKIL